MPWTPDQEQTLRLLWPTGISCQDIGKQIGVSSNAVSGKVDRLGLPKRENPVDPATWTTQEDDRLMEFLASDDYTMAEIAQFMGKSRDSVKARFEKIRRSMGRQAV